MTTRQKQRRLLGEAIRGRRHKLFFTQERLAKKSGLSLVFISRLERGVESPTLDNLARIAKALQARVRDLVREL